LLSHELLPLETLNVADLQGPFHTLRHPRLSDMAARAFIAGSDATLPKFLNPESEKIGSRNSLLRRYVGGRKGPLSEEISSIAVKETCKVELPAECATLLAGWRRSDPDSETLNEQFKEIQSDPSFAGQFNEQMLVSIGRLFGGQPLMHLEGRRSLVRARQISKLYQAYYHYALPFDRDVLRFVWEDCSGRDCRRSQRRVEQELGEIGPSRRENFGLEGPGSAKPMQNGEVEGTDLSPSPASE
jgi:hypothetical protein